jgi:hypothetical protein
MSARWEREAHVTLPRLKGGSHRITAGLDIEIPFQISLGETRLQSADKKARAGFFWIGTRGFVTRDCLISLYNGPLACDGRLPPLAFILASSFVLS